MLTSVTGWCYRLLLLLQLLSLLLVHLSQLIPLLLEHWDPLYERFLIFWILPLHLFCHGFITHTPHQLPVDTQQYSLRTSRKKLYMCCLIRWFTQHLLNLTWIPKEWQTFKGHKVTGDHTVWFKLTLLLTSTLPCSVSKTNQLADQKYM